ncbi:hypothetical protein GCM10027452_12220 [Micromonospora halotolerans]
MQGDPVVRCNGSGPARRHRGGVPTAPTLRFQRLLEEFTFGGDDGDEEADFERLVGWRRDGHRRRKDVMAASEGENPGDLLGEQKEGCVVGFPGLTARPLHPARQDHPESPGDSRVLLGWANGGAGNVGGRGPLPATSGERPGR